jgi:hypothetical protein
VPTDYPFAGLALAQRLEQAEGQGNIAFVDARARLDPAVGATWIRVGAALAMYDGAGSPLTQTFGLGMDGAPDAAAFDALEAFFLSRGAEVHHEVSPLAGVDLFATLHRRGYVPVELSSVMFRPIARGAGVSGVLNPEVRVRAIGAHEVEMFAAASARGWGESPELAGLIEGIARVAAARTGCPSFVAEVDGQPIATGSMSVWEGVAIMAGASTVPDGRRRGAQLALLDARLRAAAEVGCDLAMMCALPGSPSQRNAERHGFRIAYTRVKWQLSVALHTGDPARSL